AKPNDIFMSADHGVTFASRGMLSPTIWWKSVKVAPSRPQRVYVTGYQVAPAPAAHLFTSDDGGGHWTESALAGVQLGSTPIVLAAAVDPANPDLVYVISLGANGPGGDRLYRSTDGGATLTE